MADTFNTRMIRVFSREPYYPQLKAIMRDSSYLGLSSAEKLGCDYTDCLSCHNMFCQVVVGAAELEDTVRPFVEQVEGAFKDKVDPKILKKMLAKAKKVE